MSHVPIDKGTLSQCLDDKPAWMCAYIRGCDFLSLAMGVVAGLLLVTGVLVVCHMTFVRYVLGHSTVWQTEFATFAVAGSMLLGSAYVLQTGGHVSINLLVDATRGNVRKALQLISSLIGLAFCLALAYAFWLYVFESYHDQWTTGTVWNPPLWPAVLPMALGSTMLCLQYVAELLRGSTR